MGDISQLLCDAIFNNSKLAVLCKACGTDFKSVQDLLNHFEDFPNDHERLVCFIDSGSKS
jgi:hypothetical protein